MADQHVKGAVSTARGTLNEGAGKLTGDTELEAKGKEQKVEGKVQGLIGDVQDGLGDVQGRGRLQPIVVWAVGAVIVVVVARLLTGLLRIGRGRR